MARLIAENVTVYFPFRRSALSGPSERKVGGEIVERNGKSYVRALNKVSFDLRDGDRLALLGHNGCGKSTLLRVLAGIYRPHEGRVLIEGKMGSALNIGLGFRPEATGRRNIYLKGILAGKRRAEIDAIVDDIIDFTGLAAYIDQPLNTYSQGMLMRLSFALATTFNFDVLLMDEWLGAGDATFQKIAGERMQDFTQARISVLASHNVRLTEAWCNKTITLRHGSIVEA